MLASLAMRLCFIAAVFAVSGPSAAWAQQTIGVVGIESGHATAGDADAAQRAIVALGTSAGANRVWSVLDGAVSAARECRDSACYGALGRARGVAFVLVVGVERAGATNVPWTVSARLVDAEADRDLGMAQVEVPPGTTDWAAVLGPGLEPLVRQLPAAAPPTGTLLVTCNVSGAEVFVDGNRVATIPMEAANLPVGAHQLRVHAGRYTDLMQEARIAAGQETRVDATLTGLPAPVEPASARPFCKRPWVWGVAGAVVATGVIVAIVLATSGGDQGSVADDAVPIPDLR